MANDKQQLVSFMLDGEAVFSAPCDTVPRVGERVTSILEAREQGEFNDDAWSELQSVNGKTYVVTSVRHQFRKYAWDRCAHVVFADVEEVSD